MTYAYDNYVQLPVVDLYDTNVMKMAIEAAKDMYDKGQDYIKDFYKTYGDFMSPFAKDMEAYGQMMGGVRDLIDNAYANGIDLLKSPEGRMILSRAVNSVDPGQFNLMRSNAKLGYEYLKNVAEAETNGTFNQEYEDWVLNQKGGLGSFSNFSSAGGNVWNRPSPSKYQDPNALVSPLFEHMQDEYIDSDGQYDYSGVSRERRAQVLSANLGALLKTQSGRYQYELSKQKAQLLYGPDASEKQILDMYQNDLLDASNRFEHRTRTENKSFARREESQLRREEDTHRTRNDVWAAGEKAEKEESVKYKWDVKRAMDKNGDGEISEEERKNYSGLPKNSKDKDKENVFIRTDLNEGSNTIYDPNKAIDEKITPVNSRIAFFPPAKKEEAAVYQIPNDLIPSTLIVEENGKNRPVSVAETKATVTHWFKPDELIDDGYSNFVPTGSMTYESDKNGNKQYYIHGYISYGSEKTGNAGRVDCKMKVSRKK